MSKTITNNIEKFIEAASHSADCPEQLHKDDFHAYGQKVLNALGKKLGLKKQKPKRGQSLESGTFCVFSCRGGYSVMGEVILVSPKFEIWFCGDYGRSAQGLEILYRTVTANGSGSNCWARWEALRDFDAFIEQMRKSGLEL